MKVGYMLSDDEINQLNNHINTSLNIVQNVLKYREEMNKDDIGKEMIVLIQELSRVCNLLSE